MKKLSEVCKIIGVTRRTLQEYDKIGLLSPTYKQMDGNKNWYYDDETINKLYLITIFREADYKRQDIKKILNSTKIDLVTEYDKAIHTLENKKSEISGMIELLKAYKVCAILPKSTLFQLANQIDYESEFKNVGGFRSSINDYKKIFTNDEPLTSEEDEIVLRLIILLNILANLSGTPIKSKPIIDCVNSIFETWFTLTKFDNCYASCSYKEIWDDFKKDLPEFLDLLKEEDTKTIFTDESTDYIINAIDKYRIEDLKKVE